MAEDTLLSPSDLSTKPRPSANPPDTIETRTNYGSLTAGSIPLMLNPLLTDFLSNFSLNNPPGQQTGTSAQSSLLDSEAPYIPHNPLSPIPSGSTPPEDRYLPVREEDKRRSSLAHRPRADRGTRSRCRPRGRPRGCPGSST